MAGTQVIDTFLDAIEHARDRRLRRVERGRQPGCDSAQLAHAAAGADAIRASTARWFADPASSRSSAGTPPLTASTEIVEYTLSWSENGVPHAAHHLHVLTVRDDRIVADTVFCGGRWPASLLAEMEAAHD